MRLFNPPLLVGQSLILLSASFLFSNTSSAANVDQVVQQNNAANTAAKQSQTRIDGLADQTDKLFNEYRVVSKEY